MSERSHYINIFIFSKPIWIQYMQKELKTFFSKLQIYGKILFFCLKLISTTNEWKVSLNQYFHIFKSYLKSIYVKRTQNVLQ
jgi:hypothetical protein